MERTQFGLQKTIDGELSAEWLALLADQVAMLTALLGRLPTTPAQTIEAERLVTVLAQQYSPLTRELAELQGLVTAMALAPVDLITRMQHMACVLEVLHGNLVHARSLLTAHAQGE